MIERENGEMCSIHGPAHLGKPCPGQHVEMEVVTNPETQYSNIENLFQVENLKDDFDGVEGQLNEIRKLIHEYDRLLKQLQTDEDMASYIVDECWVDINEAFKYFTIHNKQIDIRQLCKDPFSNSKDLFDEIVSAVNKYAKDSKIGKYIQPLE